MACRSSATASRAGAKALHGGCSRSWCQPAHRPAHRSRRHLRARPCVPAASPSATRPGSFRTRGFARVAAYRLTAPQPAPAYPPSILKARRARLDPVVCGLRAAGRRTSDLRRGEVTQRADISAKWYAFLEQGRGGAPSTDVLDRLSNARALTGTKRERLFHLAQPCPK